ncbi:MAG: FHA domain-containing protein [Solirubrobacteraceae bacterium]
MSATCPRGHTSDSTDYCDVCGALITPSGGSGAEAGAGAGGAAAETASPEAADPAGTPTGAAGVPCPRCGTTNLSSAGFCEDCGLNFSDLAAVAAATLASASTDATPAGAGAAHAAAPAPPAAAAPAPSGWQARVIADRAYFDRTDAGDGEITFPADCPERVIPLRVGEVTIGRRSHASRAAPVIDLAGPPEDIGVSHAHAALTQRPDGQWEVTDSNSTNGTFIGDADAPLSPGEPIGVGEGDEIHVGAWSTIILSRVELPPA